MSERRLGDEQPYCRVVVGAQAPDGTVAYMYGWAKAPQWESQLGAPNYPDGRQQMDYTTSVEWIGTVRWSAHYPSDSDFGHVAVEQARRALEQR